MKLLFPLVSLFFLPLLCQGQPARIWQRYGLNEIFAQRLEASFKYREASLPVGNISYRSYLKVGQHRYPLTQTLLHGDEALRMDEYLLYKNGDLLQSGFKSRYIVQPSPGVSSPSQVVSFYNAYTVADQGVQELAAFLLQNFEPMSLLKGEQTTTPTGKLFFYVITRPAWPLQGGDTLASYRLEPVYRLGEPTDSSECVLTLYERYHRQDSLAHRWQGNHRSTQTWWVTGEGPMQRCVRSERDVKRWSRVYRNAYDFTETLETSSLNLMAGGGSSIHGIVYQRQYRRRGKNKAVDTYSLSDSPTVSITPVKFTILHVKN